MNNTSIFWNEEIENRPLYIDGTRVPSPSISISSTTLPDFSYFSDMTTTWPVNEYSYTGTFSTSANWFDFLVGLGADTFDVNLNSRAEMSVLLMCYQMLDSLGLWSGIYCSRDGKKERYYSVSTHGREVIELVRDKLNVIARSFREEDALGIVDDMYKAWKAGVPAMDVLA